jgi:hypothetical protein
MVFRARMTLIAPFAFALALSPLATPAFADEGVAMQDGDEDEEDAPKDVASVKIELKQPSGKVLKYDGAQLEFGADGNVTFKADDHVHDVSLRIERASDQSKAISLTVGYTKDGQSVIAPQTVDSEIKKREVIRIEGGVAIAITVSAKATKKAAPEEKPEEKPEEPPPEPPKKKDRIIDGGGNDPLDGVK